MRKYFDTFDDVIDDGDEDVVIMMITMITRVMMISTNLLVDSTVAGWRRTHQGLNHVVLVKNHHDDYASDHWNVDEQDGDDDDNDDYDNDDDDDDCDTYSSLGHTGGEVGRLRSAAPHHHAQTHLLLIHHDDHDDHDNEDYQDITTTIHAADHDNEDHHHNSDSYYDDFTANNEMITCSTDSMYIMSRSETIAPFITMISSPLMMPGEIKMLLMS